MTDLAAAELCYKCGARALRRCDFQRTAFDTCGRDCCATHGILVQPGPKARHLCDDHYRRVTAATTAYDKGRVQPK